MDDAYLDTVASTQENAWHITLLLEQIKVRFKMDTGAEVTAISDRVYKSMPSAPILQPANRALLGPARQKLGVLSQFQGTLTADSESCKQTIYVIKGLNSCLLGFPAINTLHLLQRIEPVAEKEPCIKARFKRVFTGLGTIGEEYCISLKEGARPYSLHSPRNVPIPLRSKVEEELNRMEEMGVISKVDEPTSWCAGMVVVLKKSGAVRICVDLKPLNESMLRAVHPIPTVDETLSHRHSI